MRKCDQVRMARRAFVKAYGVETLRALSVIRRQEMGQNVNSVFNARSLGTYKGNLTRGAYKEFVGPGFVNDTLNLSTFRG